MLLRPWLRAMGCNSSIAAGIGKVVDPFRHYSEPGFGVWQPPARRNRSAYWPDLRGVTTSAPMRLRSDTGPYRITSSVLTPTALAESDSSVSGRTPGITRMTLSPRNDVFSFPDPTHGQDCFWLGKIGIGTNQLVDALTRNAQNLSHFGHVHEILRHDGNLANT